MTSSATLLPSWHETAAKDAIIAFVERVTQDNSPDFVPASERLAVFDNDGTLWAEQPFYAQGLFVIDRVRDLAPEHPEWQTQEPFASVLEGDLKGVAAGGEPGLEALVVATHTAMTTDEFGEEVAAWIATARHPQTGRLFTDMVYQPMLELLGYLAANGFKTFIISGGGVEFIRVWAEQVYGIPPEQVVGSSVKLAFEMRADGPVLVKLPAADLVNEKEGKPVGIQRRLGRRPIAAFGNSDGDQQMLQWTTSGRGPRFALLVHHDDAAREWAYDRISLVGQLDKALDEAVAKGWTVVSMKQDWKTIFAE